MAKIAVLGLGESLSEYSGGFDLTIGVNDIWGKVQTDIVVCVDKPERFTPERLQTIATSRPIRFYTQVSDWKERPDYFAITLQEQYPAYECLLDIPSVPKSLCSPFVACCIAYKFHEAEEIHLFGADFISHPHLKEISIRRILVHFTTLKEALRKKRVSLIIHGSGLLSSLND